MVGWSGRVLVSGTFVRLRHTTEFIHTTGTPTTMAVLADQGLEDAVLIGAEGDREKSWVTQRTRRLLLPGPESSTGVQTIGNKE